MEQNKDRDNLAFAIQKECHEYTEMLCEAVWKEKKGRKDFKIQDAINIFFYKKLAEIELRLRELERRTTISDN